MAKEFIIRDHKDWKEMVALARPVIGVKPFRIVLYRGLKRTVDQNSLFHAVCEDCSAKAVIGKKQVHMPADWWKWHLKDALGKREVHFDLDEQATDVVVSTTEYTTKEMADFCEKIVAYMKTDFGVDIELPEELKTKRKGA